MNKHIHTYIYIDDLSCILNERLSTKPSPSALQDLLFICEKFAATNDMIYNLKKTVCMLARCKKSKVTTSPTIYYMYLNANKLKWVDDYKYLGFFVNDGFKDDLDIRRQMRAIYTRGNLLIKRFFSCIQDVKAKLFQAFCSSMYCCYLWNSFNVNSFKQLEVAYNNVFRHLMGIKGKHSISKEFLENQVDSFKIVYRKLVGSFYNRVLNSDNNLVKCIVNSSFFMYKSDLYSNTHKKAQFQWSDLIVMGKK